MARPVSLPDRKSGTSDCESHYLFHAEFCFTVFHCIPAAPLGSFRFLTWRESIGKSRIERMRGNNAIARRCTLWHARLHCLPCPFSGSIGRMPESSARTQCASRAEDEACVHVHAGRGDPPDISASADQCIHQGQILRASAVPRTCASRGQWLGCP